MAVATPILVLLGPTASGKSALALQLAQRTNAEILTVDSMQVYREMDIGTAKPTPSERQASVHHLVDIVNPDELFTVARFVELAQRVIADAAARGKPLIATGGTPLYYKSLFEGLFEGPAADASIRGKLERLPNEQLARQLAVADPSAATRIHVNDRKRLIRALEVFELTGKPISSWQTEWADPKPRFAATWVGLGWDREALNRRINARVRAMLAAGWVEETRQLLTRFGTLSHTATMATGYRELIEHLAGRTSLDDAAEQIKIGTRQLARAQMKWFRRFPNVYWMAGDQPVDALAALVQQKWR